MDLSKLSPAPWRTNHWTEDDFHRLRHSQLGGTDLEFIALARNAFDVMMRRGWWPIPRLNGGGWYLSVMSGTMTGPFCQDNRPEEFKALLRDAYWPDPFTALVEADRWYTENVEGKE